MVYIISCLRTPTAYIAATISTLRLPCVARWSSSLILAIFLVACGPTSSDSEGGNDKDGGGDTYDAATTDTDNDGVMDDQDAWPFDNSVSTAEITASDMDGDGVPDVRDIDADGDGLIEIYSADELDMIRLDYTGASMDGNANGCVYTTSERGACGGYELIADIDLSDFSPWEPLGHCVANNNCDIEYSGVFEGNGHTISNLVIDISDDAFGVGLFAAISANSEIHNLHIKDAQLTVTGENVRDVGAMVGFGRNGARIVGSSVTGLNIDAPNAIAVGGLIGDSHKAYIISSTVIADELYAYDGIGGLTGFGDSAIIEDSSAIVSSIRGHDYLSGLVGDGRNARVTSSSVNVGSISGERFIGGLIGDARNVHVEASAAFVDIMSGTYFIGGILGDALGATLISSHAAIGIIQGDTTVGGIMGWGKDASIHDSSVAVETIKGVNDVGGLIGDAPNARITSTRGLIGEITGEYSVGEFAGYSKDVSVENSRVFVGSIGETN